MKNKNIKNLNSVIPKEIRFSVYKEALEKLEDALKHPERKYPPQNCMNSDDHSAGLCLLLPCILWGMDSIFEHSPDGEPWDCRSVPTAFPEVAEGIDEIIKAEYTEKPALRIKVLKDVLNNQQL